MSATSAFTSISMQCGRDARVYNQSCFAVVLLSCLGILVTSAIDGYVCAASVCYLPSYAFAADCVILYHVICCNVFFQMNGDRLLESFWVCAHKHLTVGSEGLGLRD